MNYHDSETPNISRICVACIEYHFWGSVYLSLNGPHLNLTGLCPDRQIKVYNLNDPCWDSKRSVVISREINGAAIKLLLWKRIFKFILYVSLENRSIFDFHHDVGWLEICAQSEKKFQGTVSAHNLPVWMTQHSEWR